MNNKPKGKLMARKGTAAAASDLIPFEIIDNEVRKCSHRM